MSCNNCGFPRVYAKGLCRNCYARQLRNGTAKYRIPNRRKEPSEKQAKILESYNVTKDTKKTAEEFGCSRQYVYAVLSRFKPFTNADWLRKMDDEELAMSFELQGLLQLDCLCVSDRDW